MNAREFVLEFGSKMSPDAIRHHLRLSERQYKDLLASLIHVEAVPAARWTSSHCTRIEQARQAADDLRRHLRCLRRAIHAIKADCRSVAHIATKERRAIFKATQKLLNDYCRAEGIPQDRLCGLSRVRDIVEARLIFVRLCQELVPAASTTIVGAVLKRDHSTIMYSQKVAERRMADPRFAQRYEAARAAIRGANA